MASKRSNDEATKAVHDFADAARAFCVLVEAPQASAVTLLRALALLQLSVLQSPDLDDADREAAQRTLQPLPANGLEKDIYWLVFEPLARTPDEPVAGSLVDDLSDIRADLRRGLQLYDDGHIAAACWEWRFHYLIHWGAHLVGAQAALFHLLRERGE